MQKTTSLFVLSILTLSLSSCATTQMQPQGTNKVVLSEDVKFDQLNPARGDKSPAAGTLWGNREEETATGFLLKTTDGFKSPAHIHNVSYRGIVINGLFHNDDPKAVEMWMPAGSFWTQPAGESHITAAKGVNALAYIEIDNGPFLVMPEDEAFDNGQRPVNVDSTNIVWQNAADLVFNNTQGDKLRGVKVSYLWGETSQLGLRGNMLKLPAGFNGTLSSQAADLKAVVIKGDISYNDKSEVKLLKPGSLFSSKGLYSHKITCSSDTDCIVYLKADDDFKIY